MDLCSKIQTDSYCLVNFFHSFLIDMTDIFSQSFLVNCTDLFQQNDWIFHNIIIICTDFNMCRQFCLIHLRRNCGSDDGWTMSVAYVILYYKYRPDSPLFGTNDRTKICVINVAPLNYQFIHTPIFQLLFVFVLWFFSEPFVFLLRTY